MEYAFMKNALLAILLMTPLFGLLSTMVVSSRMAFFSDSLGHGAFTGIAIGAIAGMFSPITSLVLFSVVFALLITYIKHRTAASADTVIGVFSSTAIAVAYDYEPRRRVLKVLPAADRRCTEYYTV